MRQRVSLVACVLFVLSLGACVRSDATSGSDVSATADLHLDPAAVARGRALYGQHCASCHGASGREGGAGPSLTERHRNRNVTATEVWIAGPVAPMPRLPLDASDVVAIAMYVESL